MSTDDIHLRDLGIMNYYLGVPTRNLHSSVEVIDTKDLQSVISISENLINGISSDKELVEHLNSTIRPKY